MNAAYIDESMRRRPNDDSVYAMAAALIDPANKNDIHEALSALRLGNRRRLHWRDESSSHRLHIAKTLADLPFTALAVVHVHGRDTRHERARRLCLERLLHELGERKTAEVIIENRPGQDRLDRGLLTGLRRARRVPRSMEVRWESPLNEPLLWAADAFVGATTWWLDGHPQYFNILAEQITLICTD
ncbi:hypothetical protein ACQP2T_12415 [Nonomuraea sp. CA-143628]|uniref:hypothetical protein n=1 Tax=Nonomuraea sp. CA-143628 TaxID=3239997 RepID=UPI003D8C0498